MADRIAIERSRFWSGAARPRFLVAMLVLSVPVCLMLIQPAPKASGPIVDALDQPPSVSGTTSSDTTSDAATFVTVNLPAKVSSVLIFGGPPTTSGGFLIAEVAVQTAQNSLCTAGASLGPAAPFACCTGTGKAIARTRRTQRSQLQRRKMARVGLLKTTRLAVPICRRRFTTGTSSQATRPRPSSRGTSTTPPTRISWAWQGYRSTLAWAQRRLNQSWRSAPWRAAP